jgi:cytoskeletal protein CcmA (bactofilin family)
LTIAGAISKGEIRTQAIVGNGQTGIDLMVADKVDIKDYNLDQISDIGQELLV